MDSFTLVMLFYAVVIIVCSIIGYTKTKDYKGVLIGATIGVVLSIILYFLFGKKYIEKSKH